MIVDSSALVAILLGEEDASVYLEALQSAPDLSMSAVTLLETCVVLERRKGAGAVALLRLFISELGIRIVPLDSEGAMTAYDAYRRFGKGTGHLAQLNILDTCSYALAKIRREPLLYKGRDFSSTDLTHAIEPS